MSEWLDVMLEEIRRKEQEARAAREEQQRRKADPAEKPADEATQSK